MPRSVRLACHPLVLIPICCYQTHAASSYPGTVCNLDRTVLANPSPVPDACTAGYYGPQGAYPPPQGPYSPQQGYYAPPNGEYPKGGYPPANAYYSSPPPQQMPPPQSPPNGGYINNQFAPSVQVYESAPAQTTVITVQGGGVVGLRPISTEIESTQSCLCKRVLTARVLQEPSTISSSTSRPFSASSLECAALSRSSPCRVSLTGTLERTLPRRLSLSSHS